MDQECGKETKVIAMWENGNLERWRVLECINVKMEIDMRDNFKNV